MSKEGFTPVELLAAIVASLLVFGAIVAPFIILEYRDAQIAEMQKSVRTDVEGFKELQEPAPPERLAELQRRTEESQPLTVQAVKPSDQEAAAPVTEEGPPKMEAPELSPLELVEVKPPAAGQAFTPQDTIEPEELIVEPHKEASDVEKPLVSYEKTPWSRCVVLSWMNVRQGPSIGSKIVGKLYEDDEFQVIEEAANNNPLHSWYLIRAKSGLSGWLCGIYKGKVKFRSIRKSPAAPEMPPGVTSTINPASFRQERTADQLC